MLRAYDDVQIGIVSLAPASCKNEAGLISTFTSVARNLDWIRSIMNENCGNNQQGSGTVRPNTIPTNNKATRKPVNMYGFNHGRVIPKQ